MLIIIIYYLVFMLNPNASIYTPNLNNNNERLDKLENEFELNSISMIRNINELENKLNYLDLTYKRDLNNVNRNINDFKDRVHIIEDQINNIVSNLNDAFVIAK